MTGIKWKMTAKGYNTRMKLERKKEWQKEVRERERERDRERVRVREREQEWLKKYRLVS